MSRRPGVTRQGGVGAIGLGLMLALSGAWASGVVATPDKEPDRTPNDHPSGQDKSEEPGGSGAQGTSTSDPDGMSNGGADKPGGDGGYDADQDGNNGCGNDDDFEDDNNGNCGGRRTRGAAAGEAGVRGAQGNRSNAHAKGGPSVDDSSNVAGNGVANATGATGSAANGGTAVLSSGELRATDSATEVMGATFVRDVGATAANGDTRVLGVSASRGSGGLVGTGSALATTGVPIVALIALGSVMVATGRALTIAGHRDETTA